MTTTVIVESEANRKTFYPPKVERASRSTGPRIATAPNNEDARPRSGGECPWRTDRSPLAELAHDTTEGSRASDVVPAKPMAAVAQNPMITTEQLPETQLTKALEDFNAAFGYDLRAPIDPCSLESAAYIAGRRGRPDLAEQLRACIPKDVE